MGLLRHKRSRYSSVGELVCSRSSSLECQSGLAIECLLGLVRRVVFLFQELGVFIWWFVGRPLRTRQVRVISISVVSPPVAQRVSYPGLVIPSLSICCWRQLSSCAVALAPNSAYGNWFFVPEYSFSCRREDTTHWAIHERSSHKYVDGKLAYKAESNSYLQISDMYML